VVAVLDRKLLRNLGTLKGQVVTIALVVACGVAGFTTMRSTWSSLLNSRDAYYERYRFADVFAQVKRAPESLAVRIEALDGVASVYTRVVDTITLPIEGMPDPAVGRVVSLPRSGRPPMNDLALQQGRLPEPGHNDEVVVLDAFAEAHQLEPGDTLPAVLNGTLRQLRVVGTAMSPEYIFAIDPGDIAPDDKKFGVLWMEREAVAAAFDMEGAFNDVCIRMQRGASQDNLLSDLDRLLEPYGGFGAVGRDRQISNFYIEQEMAQLELQATMVPSIFLAVAAFLLNVVLSRLVQLQRPQIAALKALGYSDRAIGWHFLKLVSVIVLLGVALGIALGGWLGREMTELYTEYFRLPTLKYELDVAVVVSASAVSLLAAVVGGMGAVKSVVSLPPAEAMRPPPPASYKRMLVERLGVGKVLGESATMVLREIRRRPARFLMSTIGISMAVGILVVARFFMDAMDFLVDDYMQMATTEDLAVTFLQPEPERARRELEHLPGVYRAEGLRIVPVRYRAGHRWRESALIGYPEVMEMRRLVDDEMHEFQPPEDGVLLTRLLGEILHVRPGDFVTVELLEGNRQTLRVPVAGLVDEMFGLQGHMRADALSRLLGEEPSVSQVLLDVDTERIDEVYAALRERPGVRRIASRMAAIDHFRDQSGRTTGVMTLILTLFAVTIAVGVVYNNARISLSTRNRDLASLRVLGFTRREVAAILLGEIAAQVILALPIGLVVGRKLAQAMLDSAYQEAWRMPAVISDQTFAFASLITIAAALFSAWLVREKLARLDLIGVLKTRE